MESTARPHVNVSGEQEVAISAPHEKIAIAIL